MRVLCTLANTAHAKSLVVRLPMQKTKVKIPPLIALCNPIHVQNIGEAQAKQLFRCLNVMFSH